MLICVMSAILIFFGYIENKVREKFVGPFSLNSNYISFTLQEDSAGLANSLYDELINRTGVTQIITFDSESSIMYAKPFGGLLSYDIQMVLGAELNEYYFYREKSVAILNSNQFDILEFVVDTELEIDGKQFLAIGLFEEKSPDIHNVSAIANIVALKNLKTHTFISTTTVHEHDLIFKMLIDAGATDVEHYEVTFRSVIGEFQMLSDLERAVLILLCMAIFAFLLIDYTDKTRKLKEYEFLKKTGISPQNIVLRELKSFLVELALAAVFF